MQLTLTEAADETGKSKSTLLRAISSGRLSASRNEHGEYRVDPGELFRVYPQATTGEQVRSDPQGSEMVVGLLEMVKLKDAELSSIRAELDETKERLDEHREAARALISPDDFEAKVAAERERLEREKMEALALKQRQYDKAMEVEREQQAQQHEEWKASLAKRQAEIKQARAEAESLREREREQAEALKRERERLAALESRGLIARLFNRKPIIG